MRPLQDPATILLGCTVWLPLMLWISALIHWMVGGDIEVPAGVMGVLAGLGLGVLTVNPPVKALQPLAYIAVWITLVMFPFVRSAMNSRALKSVDLYALERAYSALGNRPRDPFLRFKLAQAAWTLGLTGHAMRIAEAALPELDPKIFSEEHRILRIWHREQPGADMFVDYACLACGGPCPPGRTHCPSCGAPFLYDIARGKTFNPLLGRRIVAAWVAAAVALAGIPWATTLSPTAAIGAIIAILGAAFLVVFLAFRPRGQAT